VLDEGVVVDDVLVLHLSGLRVHGGSGDCARLGVILLLLCANWGATEGLTYSVTGPCQKD